MVANQIFSRGWRFRPNRTFTNYPRHEPLMMPSYLLYSAILFAFFLLFEWHSNTAVVAHRVVHSNHLHSHHHSSNQSLLATVDRLPSSSLIETTQKQETPQSNRSIASDGAHSLSWRHNHRQRRWHSWNASIGAATQDVAHLHHHHRDHHHHYVSSLREPYESLDHQHNQPSTSTRLLNHIDEQDGYGHHQYYLQQQHYQQIPLEILPIENVTVSVGRNAVLTCAINRPGQYKVAWLKMDDNSEPTLLTLGIYSLVNEDEGKYKVTHNERQWLLHINRVQVSDRGRYMCQINAQTMTSQIGYLDVYEPPVINEELTSSDTTVDELQKVSLRCATNGYPSPSVSWRRENGKALNLGLYGGKKFAAHKWDGEYLNISQVTREDMGAYLCIASNGVPPSVSKRIVLQVNFRPKIRVHNQLVSAYLGSDVELECRVESSPKPETIWFTGTGQKLEELMDQYESVDVDQRKDQHNYIRTNVNGQSKLLTNHFQSKRKKYQFDEESDGYRTVMRLTIRRLEPMDFGSYKCVAKNNLGEKEGLVRLYEIPVPTLPPTTSTTTLKPSTTTAKDGQRRMTNEKWTNSNGKQPQQPGVNTGRTLREQSDHKSPFEEWDDTDETDYADSSYLEFYRKKIKTRAKNDSPHLSTIVPVFTLPLLLLFLVTPLYL